MRNMKEFYRSKYKGRIFVIKAGGRIIADDKARKSLLTNIQDLTAHGIKVLLVYGGGKAIDQALEDNGLELKKTNGRRITTAKTIDIVKHVMAGDLGCKISSTMAELKMDGFCMNSIPPSWIDIELRPRENSEEFGYDGTVKEVYAEKIRHAFEDILFIAMPCIGVTAKNAVNINADDVAVAIATGCETRKLVFLSDVDGVLINGKTASFITDKEIPELIENGTVEGGMKVKLENCIRALDDGVRRIHLLNGFSENVLANEIYESTGAATMIIKEEDKQSYLNEIEAQKIIEAQK